MADLHLQDASEVARLFQRSVVHETLIPLLTSGAAKQHLVHRVATALTEHLEEQRNISDVILKAAVEDVSSIAHALLCLTSANAAPSTDSLDTLARSREGVKLLVHQAISQQRCYSERLKEVREHAVAQLAHGPALQQTLKKLGETAFH